jgi:hypothetical protein
MEVKIMRSYDDLLGNGEDEQIKKNLGFKGEAVTYVGFIGDHSGSMGEPVSREEVSPKKSELAMSNFNEQIATLKKESEEGMETLVTVIDFDNEIICQNDNVDIADVQPLTEYWTRGMTSLYDAIAFGISRIKKRMSEDPRDNKAALMVIETDGYENASSDYAIHDGGRERLKELIKGLEGEGNWTFTFLGAGLDEEFAQELGMAFGNIATTRAGNLGDTVHAYAAQSSGIKSFMGDRKRGVLNKSDFYSSPDVDNDNDSDGTSGKWEDRPDEAKSGK